ncbi:MAG: A24 family peptidase [Gammaproteobacteria bacterium]
MFINYHFSFDVFFVVVTIGLAIGSFLNVVIYRLPIFLQARWKGEIRDQACLPLFRSLCFPRSFCPHCKSPIPFWSNIPLLGFIILQGRCYCCSEKISWRYPLVEFISAGAAIILLLRFGVTEKYIVSLIFTCFLIILAYIDFDYFLLPDELTLALLWLGLVFSLKNYFVGSEEAILGAACGYMSLWLIAQIFRLIRGIEGIGYGDFKLAAALGAWLGWQSIPWLIFSAAFLGSCVGLIMRFRKYSKGQVQLPFGPFLAIAGWFLLYLS